MSSVARRAPNCWSSIPTELAGVVLRRLPCHADRVRFAAVCKQWRASARQSSPPLHYPWLALPDRTFYSLPGSAFQPLPLHLDRHRQLPQAQSSCGEWLVFERFDGAYTLVSPFSMSTTILLPGLSDTYAPNVPLLVANDQPVPDMLKLVVCSDNLVAAIVNDNEALTYRSKLALCRPGASSWWSSTPDELRHLQDIVSCGGKLYALDKFNGLFSVSIGTGRRTGDPTVSRVEHLMGSPRGVLKHSSQYLLESSGTLLLVCREDVMFEGCSSGSMSALMDGLELELELEFEVLKADLKRSRWTDVRSVGDDRVLFVGPWCSRAVHVSGACEQDCLYNGDRIFFMVDVSAKRYNHRYYGYGAQREPFYCIVYDMRTQRSELFLETTARPLKGFPVTWLFPPSQG
ncbi:F-box protein At2g17036-like [Triticum aestivum]|nr:F-box protein At2g17036-like [Triticum aestivum]